jgi:hypothetical protein
MRCGVSRGVSSPFYRGRGSAGEGWPRRSNGGVNGFNAIEDGGEVKRGIKGGNDGGASNGSGGIRGVELGSAGSGGRWWRCGRARRSRR